MSIHIASEADIPVIRGLAMQVWPQTYVSIVGAEQVAYMLDLFYSPAALQKQMLGGHTFIIGYDGGNPVAFASWSRVKDDVYKLHKLYILPGLQGKGTGKAMVGHIVQELRSVGASALQLNVNRYNHNAIGFYEKVGFHRMYDEDIDIGNGFFMNDHVLELKV